MHVATWREIIEKHKVSGRQAHEAYHVAAMLAHGLNRVLMLDKRDFERYGEIESVFLSNLEL